jgi:hypothetical protein
MKAVFVPISPGIKVDKLAFLLSDSRAAVTACSFSDLLNSIIEGRGFEPRPALNQSFEASSPIDPSLRSSRLRFGRN